MERGRVPHGVVDVAVRGVQQGAPPGVQVGAVGRSEHFEAGVYPGDHLSGSQGRFVFHELNITRFGWKSKGANRTSAVRVTVPRS